MTTISLNTELARMKGEKGPADLIEYAGRASGAFRITGVFQKALKTVGLAGYSTPEMCRVQADLGTTGSVLGVLGVPRAIADASQSVSALSDRTICLTRRVANAAANGLSAVGALGFAGMYLCGMGWLLAPVRLIDTAADAVECQINASNLSHVAQLERQAPGGAQEAIAHSKRFYMLKTIIKATSVGLSIIGTALWASGISFGAGLGLSVVSLLLTAAAIRADLFKDPQKLLKCDRTIVV